MNHTESGNHHGGTTPCSRSHGNEGPTIVRPKEVGTGNLRCFRQDARRHAVIGQSWHVADPDAEPTPVARCSMPECSRAQTECGSCGWSTPMRDGISPGRRSEKMPCIRDRDRESETTERRTGCRKGPHWKRAGGASS